MGPDRPAEVLTLGLVATVAPYHAACSICGAMPIRITLDLTSFLGRYMERYTGSWLGLFHIVV